MQFEASVWEWVCLLVIFFVWNATIIFTQPAGAAFLKECAAYLAKNRFRTGPEQVHHRR